ncbi:MAG: hypothetical protein ABJL67_19045 [Sulfitobacter sp.]
MAKKQKRRTGRGAILIMALMLTSSAILRIVAGPAEAVAEALAKPEDAEMAMKTSMAEDTLEGGSNAATQAQEPPTINRTEIGDLLTALKEREKRVIEREKQLEMRGKALAVADIEITKRLETLEIAEANLRATLSLADGAAEDDLARLTTVYESMKPKDAAALFETMEPDFAAGFLGRMRPDAAASVMAGLSPDVAYSISVILAGRNANVPKS